MTAVAVIRSDAQPALAPVPLELRDTPLVRALMSPEGRSILMARIAGRPGVSPERVISLAYTAAEDNQEINQCTPGSIISAVAKAVSRDLEIGVTAHLVPVNVNIAKKGQEAKWEKRLQMWPDYKGDIETIIKSGACRIVTAHPVYAGEIEKDRFDVDYAASPPVRHRPILSAKDRGAIAGAYAFALDGRGLTVACEWVPIEEIEAVRAKSKNWSPEKVAACPYWYAIKTAVHRMAKMLPKNPAMRTLLADLDGDAKVDQGEIADGEFEEIASEQPTIAATSSAAPTRTVAVPATPSQVEIPGSMPWANNYPYQTRTLGEVKLGDLSVDQLVTLGEHIVGKQAKAGDLSIDNDALKAIHLLLKRADAQKPAPIETPTGKPGPVAAALTQQDEARVGGLIAALEDVVADGEWNPEQRAQMLKEIAATPMTVAALEQKLAKFEKDLSLPF